MLTLGHMERKCMLWRFGKFRLSDQNPGRGTNAFLYLLLHEATHVLYAVLKLTPHPFEKAESVTGTTFTNGIWEKLLIPSKIYGDSLLGKTCFRSGNSVPVNLAPAIYRSLEKTPLYHFMEWPAGRKILQSWKQFIIWQLSWSNLFTCKSVKMTTKLCGLSRWKILRLKGGWNS